MKKTVFMTVVLFTCTFFGIAASPAVGTWDCVASVDQDYPFTLVITEVDGQLQGTAKATSGDGGPVEKIKLENGVLSFTVESASVGSIDFEATLDGESMKGTLESYDFGGEFTGKLRK